MDDSHCSGLGIMLGCAGAVALALSWQGLVGFLLGAVTVIAAAIVVSGDGDDL